MPGGPSEKIAIVARSLMDQAQRTRQETLRLVEERMAEARRMYEQAIGLARQAGSRPELIQGLKGLGQIERDSGALDKALGHYEEALSVAQEEGEPLVFAHILRHIGDIRLASGHPAEARAAYGEAVKTYLAHPEAPAGDVANALRALAILSESTGDERAAVPLWEEARERYKQAGIAEGIVESSQRLDRLTR